VALFRSHDDKVLSSLTKAIRLLLPADPGFDRMLDACQQYRPAARPSRMNHRQEPGGPPGSAGRYRWAGGGTCRKPTGADSFSWARLAGVGDSHWKCICSGPMVSSTGR
jgi:hypothetical protein